jgi:cyclophilin family peptidyl-prolyl cis-trans isomerase/HEAT repeat protein
VPERDKPHALLTAELARDAEAPGIEDDLRSEDDATEARAAWTLGRIGGERALVRLTRMLDGDRGREALAALALLQPPRDASGGPIEPQGRWKELEDALWTRYALTPDPDPAEAEDHAEALLLAIARTGGPESLARLAIDLRRVPAREEGAARGRYIAGLEALALMCARGWALDERSRDAVAQGLDHGEPEVRQASAYALGRCVSSSAELLALTEEREVLLERLERQLSGGGDTRLTWKAFAAIGETPKIIPDEVLGDSPPNWLVEVEAVRALGHTPAGRAAIVERLPKIPLETVLAEARVHVVLEALRALRPSAATEPSVGTMARGLGARLKLEDQGKGTSPSEAQRARVHIALELATLQGIATGHDEQLPDCAELGATGVLPAGYCTSALVEGIMHMSRHAGASPTATSKLPPEAQADSDDAARKARIDLLIRLAEDPRAATAAPALAALAEVSDLRAKQVLRGALRRPDPGVRAAAATSVATRSLDAEKRDLDAVDDLVAVVRESQNEDAIEARIAAIGALGRLGRAARSAVVEGGSRVEAPPDSPWLSEVVLPLAADPNIAVRDQARRALLGHESLVSAFDAREVPSAEGSFGGELASSVTSDAPVPSGLRMVTTRGPVEISFEGAPAPINQANLSQLANEKFFHGLSFHRVVPGFVVQGGDPRGDGYGGPGHLVPCEWSNLRYERGTVGIALAGKDTGGSQIFIAQTPQPHLDARYTVVGHVTEGMDVVDRLLPGDAIVSMEVLAGNPPESTP